MHLKSFQQNITTTVPFESVSMHSHNRSNFDTLIVIGGNMSLDLTLNETENGLKFPSNVFGEEDDDTEYIFDRLLVKVVFISVYTIVFCSCFFGNLAVILVIGLHSKMRSMTNFYLLNLCFANLCVGVFCIYQNLSTYFMKSWVFGNILCKMYHFVNSLSHTASILILVLICFERYIVIIHPVRCKQIMTINRLKGSILTVWLAAGIYNSPRLYYINTVSIPLMDGDIEILCIAKRTLYDSNIFDLINFTLLFLIPLGIISVLYTLIGIALWKSSNQIMMTETTCKHNIDNKSNFSSFTCNQMNKKNMMSDSDSDRLDDKRRSTHDKNNKSFPASCKFWSWCLHRIHDIQPTHNSKQNFEDSNDDKVSTKESCQRNCICISSVGERQYLSGQNETCLIEQREVVCMTSSELHRNREMKTMVTTNHDSSSSHNIKRKPIPIPTISMTVTGWQREICDKIQGSHCQVDIEGTQELEQDSYLYSTVETESDKVKSGIRDGSNRPTASLIRSFNDKKIVDKLAAQKSHQEDDNKIPKLRLKRAGAIKAYHRSGAESLRSRRRVIKLLVAIVIVFAICNFPYHFRKIWQIFSSNYEGSSRFSALFTPLTFICMYSQCALCPLTTFMSSTFRASCRQVISYRFSQRRQILRSGVVQAGDKNHTCHAPVPMSMSMCVPSSTDVEYLSNV